MLKMNVINIAFVINRIQQLAGFNTRYSSYPLNEHNQDVCTIVQEFNATMKNKYDMFPKIIKVKGIGREDLDNITNWHYDIKDIRDSNNVKVQDWEFNVYEGLFFKGKFKPSKYLSDEKYIIYGRPKFPTLYCNFVSFNICNEDNDPTKSKSISEYYEQAKNDWDIWTKSAAPYKPIGISLEKFYGEIKNACKTGEKISPRVVFFPSLLEVKYEMKLDFLDYITFLTAKNLVVYNSLPWDPIKEQELKLLERKLIDDRSINVRSV